MAPEWNAEGGNCIMKRSGPRQGYMPDVEEQLVRHGHWVAGANFVCKKLALRFLHEKVGP